MKKGVMSLFSILLFLVIFSSVLCSASFADRCLSPPDKCVEIKNLYSKAISESDVSYCDSIYTKGLGATLRFDDSSEIFTESRSIKKACYGEVLASAKNANLCESVSPEKYCAGEINFQNICTGYSFDTLKETCYSALSNNTNNPDYCEKDIQRKAQCYTNYVMSSKDSSYCEKIEGIENKQRCYNSIGESNLLYSIILYAMGYSILILLPLSTLAPFVFFIFLFLTGLFSYKFYKAIKNEYPIRRILYVLLSIISLAVAGYCLWIWIFHWPPAPFSY